jgi:hypothetical protein
VTPEWLGVRAGVILDSRLVVLITLPDAGKMRLETNSKGKWTRGGNDIWQRKSLP